MADNNFINFEIESDAQGLADNAVEGLQEAWDGWEPNEGDPEVVVIETIAPMAQNAAEVAAQVPMEVLREVGQQIHGIPYTEGLRAETTLTVRVLSVPATGYVLDAGVEFVIDGFAFRVDNDVTFDESLTPVEEVVEVTAAEAGADYNDLTGLDVSPLDSLTWIDTVVVDTPTSGGTDEETDDAYMQRLVRELRLQAKTLVTARDYELMALNQTGIGRAHAENDGARNVLVVVTDDEGGVCTTDVKDALEELYDGYREVNTVFNITDAGYNSIDVDYEVVRYPGFDTTDLVARIDAMLTELLSPRNWGNTLLLSEDSESAATWVQDNTVRLNKLIGKIENVEGVDYVDTLEINSVAADFAMTGTVALPTADTITGSVVN